MADQTPDGPYTPRRASDQQQMFDLALTLGRIEEQVSAGRRETADAVKRLVTGHADHELRIRALEKAENGRTAAVEAARQARDDVREEDQRLGWSPKAMLIAGVTGGGTLVGAIGALVQLFHG